MAAEQLDAGLVVIASGGRGLSAPVLLGSTATQVQQYAPCPVLVVRPAPKRCGRLPDGSGHAAAWCVWTRRSPCP